MSNEKIMPLSSAAAEQLRHRVEHYSLRLSQATDRQECSFLRREINTAETILQRNHLIIFDNESRYSKPSDRSELCNPVRIEIAQFPIHQKLHIQTRKRKKD